MRYNKKLHVLFVSTLMAGTAMAQLPVQKPFIMKSPDEFYITGASANGKWACGCYVDYSDQTYGFLWNLESGEIEMLNPSIQSYATSVSDEGLVVGQFSDNTFRANGASVDVAGYWQDHKWHRLEMPNDEIEESDALSVSPDGHYISGNTTEGQIYTGYIWKDGKIYKELLNTTVSRPYAIHPNGQSAAGWIQKDNRACCIWEENGQVTILSDYQSPWSYARQYSPDGKLLLYYDGWKNFGTDTEEKWGINCIYDLATKTSKPVFPVEDGALDFIGISNKGSVIGVNNDRAMIYQNGVSYYVEDYLKDRGIDWSEEHVFMAPETNYYQLYFGTTISADDNVLGIRYYNDDKDENGEYSIAVQSMAVKLDYQTSGLAPVSLKAAQSYGMNSVRLTWKPNVTAQGISGYNVYRDGEKINTALVTSEAFLDAAASVGTHKYTVSAVYGSEESAKSEEATVTVAEKKLSAPNTLFAQQRGYNSAYLQWNAPHTNFGSLTYFDPETASLEGFGIASKVNFENAVRFDSTMTAAYKGQKISSVGFYPLSEQGGWKINLYTYNADGSLQLLYSQPVTQKLNYDERNTVALNTPVDVPAGELIVAVEVTVATPSQNIIGLDYGKSTKNYTDMLRVVGEDQFYSIGDVFETSGYLYPATWSIDATITPTDADLTKDNVSRYDVYSDGVLVGTANKLSYMLDNLSDGEHTLGIKAVYANGTESDLSTTTLNIASNSAHLQTVDTVLVAPQPGAAIHAEWAKPVDHDLVSIQYCKETASSQSVIAPADNNYGLMVGALYPAKTFTGRNGYKITSVRFYPKGDATFTVLIYKDDELVNETEVDDYTLNKWNEVKLSEPVVIDSKSTYRLVIDCYDVTPQATAIALDGNTPVVGYSDIYSLDGESWDQLSSGAIYGNWLIGMNIETPDAVSLPVAGYDVNIDGVKKNNEMLTTTSFDYDFGTEDTKQHTISVDVYYTVAPTAMKGGITRFYIGATGVESNVVDRIVVSQGDNEITVSGAGVTSVDVISAAGATVASAKGNTVSVNGLAAGVYVVKAVVSGETVTRKIQIVK